VTAAARFSFVQITDLHLGFREVASPEPLVEDLRQIERETGERAAFIVATGDLTDHGAEAECRMYLEAIRATRLKIHPVVGNHDYIHLVGQEAKQDAGSYQRLISPLNYSFDWQGVHFVSYDYFPPENRKQVTPWLRNDLSAQPKGTPVIFLTHDQLPAAFYEQLGEFRIVATLSGHWHSSRLYHDGRIAHFNGPSLCFGGIDYSPRAYRLFTWEGERLMCETIPLRKPTGLLASPARKLSAAPWPVALRGEVHLAAPVVQQGRVFLGLMDEQQPGNGAVASWDSDTGREVWRAPLAASVKNTLAWHDHKVIAATVTGEVAALDRDTGARVWSYQLGDASRRWIFSSPVVRDGRVFVGQGPHFSALDAATGQPLWVRTDLTENDWISSYVSPASDGERVFVGFHWKPRSVRALDAGSGQALWQQPGEPKSSSPVSPIVLDGCGGLYVVLQRGLCKLDAATGVILWEFPLGETWSPAAPCVDHDTIYAASGAGVVFAVDAEDGRKRWESHCSEADDSSAMHPYRRRGRAIVSSPRAHGDSLLVGTNDGRLVRLDKNTGALQSFVQFHVPLTSSPTIAGGRIFLAARDGNLYSLRA